MYIYIHLLIYMAWRKRAQNFLPSDYTYIAVRYACFCNNNKIKL